MQTARLRALAPFSAPLAAVLLAACASQPATTADGRAAPMPARTPATACLGCGTISAREPGDLPRWIFRVQMDDGSESRVFQERADWLVVGARVRLAGGQMLKP